MMAIAQQVATTLLVRLAAQSTASDPTARPPGTALGKPGPCGALATAAGGGSSGSGATSEDGGSGHSSGASDGDNSPSGASGDSGDGRASEESPVAASNEGLPEAIPGPESGGDACVMSDLTLGEGPTEPDPALSDVAAGKEGPACYGPDSGLSEHELTEKLIAEAQASGQDPHAYLQEMRRSLDDPALRNDVSLMNAHYYEKANGIRDVLGPGAAHSACAFYEAMKASGVGDDLMHHMGFGKPGQPPSAYHPSPFHYCHDGASGSPPTPYGPPSPSPPSPGIPFIRDPATLLPPETNGPNCPPVPGNICYDPLTGQGTAH